MQSKAADVPAYIAEAPAARQQALERLRALCRERLVGYVEAMRWGLPTYARHGAAEIAFASQKQYIALYVMKQDVMRRHAADLAGLDVGKGCIRWRTPAQIDFDLVRRLLDATASSTAPAC